MFRSFNDVQMHADSVLSHKKKKPENEISRVSPPSNFIFKGVGIFHGRGSFLQVPDEKLAPTSNPTVWAPLVGLLLGVTAPVVDPSSG